MNKTGKRKTKGQRHHYLPEFYIKTWCAPDGELCEYSKPYNNIVKCHRRAPKGTGYVHGLYKLTGASPEIQNRFEEVLLKRADNDASDALKILLSLENSAWDDRRRIGWSRFVLSLTVRMPTDVALIKSAVSEQLTSGDPIVESSYQQFRRESDPQSAKEYFSAIGEKTPDILRNEGFRVLSRLIQHEELEERIANRFWFVIKTEAARHSILTFDDPILWCNDFPTASPVLMVPIGPRDIFVAAHDKHEARVFGAISPSSLTVYVNRKITEGARHIVVGTDDKQLRFVQNHMGKCLRPRELQRIWQSRQEELRRLSVRAPME